MPDMNPDQTVIPDGPYADMDPMPTAARSEGPYARMAGEVAKRGRYGDTMLMHVNPLEVEALSRAYPGMVTKNPDTGYPEAFWFLPAIAQALAAVGPTVAAGAAMVLPQAVATGIGSVVGAVPGMLGTALGSGGLSGALTAAGLPGMATAGELTAAGIAKLGTALPTISGKIAAAGQTMAGGEGLAGALHTGMQTVGSGLGEVLAAPVNAAAEVLGTGTTGAPPPVPGPSPFPPPPLTPPTAPGPWLPGEAPLLGAPPGAPPYVPPPVTPPTAPGPWLPGEAPLLEGAPAGLETAPAAEALEQIGTNLKSLIRR